MTAEATSAPEITGEAHLEAGKRISKFSYQKPEAFDDAGAKNSGRTDSAPRNPRLTDIGEFKHFSAEVESGRGAKPE